jgi:hypothetical protein
MLFGSIFWLISQSNQMLYVLATYIIHNDLGNAVFTLCKSKAAKPKTQNGMRLNTFSRAVLQLRY